MTFQGRLLIEPIASPTGVRWWRLAEPLSYYSWRIGKMLVVPEGFATDLASIPRIAQPIIPKDGGVLWPAVLHDYLYSRDAPADISRAQADRIFLDAMTIDGGMGPITRGLVYNMVRLFAGRSFRKR